MSDHSELFENIRKFIADNRTLLGAGASVELAGLDIHVKNLCEQVLSLPPEDSAQYAELLQELFNELNILSEDLLTKRDALAHEIRYLSSHKKANVAYKVADSKDATNVVEDEEGK
jgi:hypothetical protein